MRRPWEDMPGWDIVGMNHYYVDGQRMLFVAMVKDECCIKEEGKDDEYLWNRLWHKAKSADTAVAQSLGFSYPKEYTDLVLDAAKENNILLRLAMTKTSFFI